MSIGACLKETRERRELHQYQVGGLAGYSVQMISAIERGDRQGDVQVIAGVARKLGDGTLLAEVASEVTGDVFVQPPLNGPAVDLHHCAVLTKAIEEAQEFIAAAETIRRMATRPTSTWTPDEIELAATVIQQAIDMEGAAEVFATVFAECTNKSLTALYREHQEKLKMRGYRR